MLKSQNRPAAANRKDTILRIIWMYLDQFVWTLVKLFSE